MKNIVVINAYGYKNIGDAAILDMTLRLLEKAAGGPLKIDVHTVNPDSTGTSIKLKSEIKTMLNPYGVAIRNENRQLSDLSKMYRFIIVIFSTILFSLLGKISKELLTENKDYKFIKSTYAADTVFGIGGGYFRTKDKNRDYFGLLLTLLPVLVAHLYGKKIVYFPMSYGNFASPIHEYLTYITIKKDKIIFRDKISMKQFLKMTNDRTEHTLFPDIALLNDEIKSNKKEKYIVLTARKWFIDNKQEMYEKTLIEAVKYVWKKYKLKTKFIPMAWNEIEDNDNKVAKRIEANLGKNNFFEIVNPKTPKEVQEILSKGYFAICTRMHSAILSLTVNTPFICIAYEYKTNGLLEQLGLDKWNININEINFLKLKGKIDTLMITKNYKEFKKQLKDQHIKIRKMEEMLLNQIREHLNKNE